MPKSSSTGVNNTALQNTFYDASQTAAVIGGASAAGSALQTTLGNLLKPKQQNTGTQGKNKGNKGNLAKNALATILNNAGPTAGLAAVGGLTQTGAIFNQGKDRFITQPPFILMTYMRGAKEHPFIQPLLPAAINQIDFDFTPTGNYTTVGDFGATKKATTVGVTVTMQLTEVTNLYADTLFDNRPKLS